MTFFFGVLFKQVNNSVRSSDFLLLLFGSHGAADPMANIYLTELNKFFDINDLLLSTDKV